jgi:RNA polymerase sigma-70 factor, ECF subfamily
MTIATTGALELPPRARPPPASISNASPRRGAFDSELVVLIPNLKSFARAMCADGPLAEELVQETCARALANHRSFKAGTNMRAWLFTILRNSFYTRLRKRKREVEDVDGKYTDSLTVQPNQDPSADLRDAVTALGRMPPQHQEVLIHLGCEGLSYEEVARRSRCAVGTVKSRTHRARRQLNALLTEAPQRGARG